LAAYLDALEREQALPKTIIYNSNPADNYVFATMLGNFPGECATKVQMGSGWWFLDRRKAWSGSSMRCPTWGCCHGLWGW